MCNPSIFITRLAASSLVLASSGFGAVYAYQAGIPHGQTLAVLSVVFAISLELLKPLAVSAAIQAALSWQIIRSLLLAILGAVAIAYSLTAELSLMAGSRSDLSAQRQAIVSSADRAADRYTNATKELAALPKARLVGEIEADLERARNRHWIAKLNGELARAERKAELEAILDNSSVATMAIKSADPGASAIQLYASLFGYSIKTDTISQLLYLVPVLALEIGSALSLVLVGVVSGAAPKKEAPVMVQQEMELDSAYTRDAVARKLVNHLMNHHGSLLLSERDLAKVLKADRNTTRRAIQGLADAKLLTYEPSKKGTALKLAAK